MLAKCITNKVRGLGLDSEFTREMSSEFGVGEEPGHLTIGRLYVVYAVAIESGWLRYFLANDAYPATAYPVPYSAPLFELIDRRVSQCWTLGCQDATVRAPETIFTFREWATNPGFYERLVDGSQTERRLFEEWKEVMDLEFLDPRVDGVAEVIDAQWLTCPRCEDSWECAATTAMVRCPTCMSVSSNPRHR